MKKIVGILLFTFVTLPHLSAQLKVYESMQKNVVIHADSSINQLIQDKIDGVIREEVQIQGYRVQVFSSNNQQEAKTQAFAVEKLIKDASLGIEIYVTFNPPFWKVRLGDFRTQEEALLLKAELNQKFPQLQAETYVVRDQITVINR